MNKKGFSMLEVIIVIALMGIVIGIGIPSVSGINFRAHVKADQILGGELGTALMQLDMSDGIETITDVVTPCSEIDDLEKYVNKNEKPEAMKNGEYVAAKVKVNGQSILLIGIRQNGEEIGKTDIYDGKNSGWVWSSKGEIDKVLSTYGSQISITNPEPEIPEVPETPEIPDIAEAPEAQIPMMAAAWKWLY